MRELTAKPLAWGIWALSVGPAKPNLGLSILATAVEAVTFQRSGGARPADREAPRVRDRATPYKVLGVQLPHGPVVCQRRVSSLGWHGASRR